MQTTNTTDTTSLVARAWALLAESCSARGASLIGEARAAHAAAIESAQADYLKIERAYPGKSASQATKTAWLAQKEEARVQRNHTLASLAPLRKRADAYASGDGKKYDREVEAQQERDAPKLARLARDIDAREARIGHRLDGETVNALRRAYLGH